jgi:hypothetical protein
VIGPQKAMEMELIAWGYGGLNMPFRYQENGFIIILIFEDWITNLLISYIAKEPIKSNYTGVAVLLLDGCICHSTERVQTILDEQGILFHFIPPHSSDQTQPLDLGVFGNLKRGYMKRLGIKTSTKQTD